MKKKTTSVKKLTESTALVVTPSEIVPDEEVYKKKRDDQIKIEELTHYNRERIGIAVPEYRKDTPTKEDALVALDTLRQFVFSKGLLEKDIREKINEVLNDHSNRIKMFLVGMSRLKIDNLYNMAKDIERVETELVSRNFDRIDTETLISIYKTLTTRETELLDFIGQMQQSNLPNQLDDREEEVRELVEKLESRGISVPNVAGRRNVTSLLDKVMRDARLINNKSLIDKKKKKK